MSARGFIPAASSDGGSGAAGFPIWYYVDASGQTQGAYTLQQLATLFYTGHINENVYVWNGHDVKTWIELRSLPHVLSFIKEQRLMMKPLTASSASTGKFFHDPSSGAPSGGSGGSSHLTTSMATSYDHHHPSARADPMGHSPSYSSEEDDYSDTDRGDLATEDRRAVIRSKKARPKKSAGSGISGGSGGGGSGFAGPSGLVPSQSAPAVRESPKERAHTVGTVASFAGGGYSSPPRAIHVVAGMGGGSQQHMVSGWHGGGGASHSYGAGPGRYAAGPYGAYPPHAAAAPMGYPPPGGGGGGRGGPPTMATYDTSHMGGGMPTGSVDYGHSQSARTLSSSRPGSRRGSKSDGRGSGGKSGATSATTGAGGGAAGGVSGSKRSLQFRDRTAHHYSATVAGGASVRGFTAVPPPPGPPSGDPPPSMKSDRSGGRSGGHGYSQVPSHTVTDARAKPILSKFEAKGKRQDIIGEHKRYAKALEERSQTLRQALDTKVKDLEHHLQSALDSQLVKWERALQKVDLLETKRKMESSSAEEERQAKLDQQIASALESIQTMSLKPEWERIEGQVLTLLEALQSSDD